MKEGFVNSTLLKLLALIFMTVDHVGMLLFSNNDAMRIIGRLAFPIFAFFIAEGCRYTRNRLNYFLRIFAVGFVSQVVYSLFSHTLFINIFLTFSVSVLIINSIKFARKSNKKFAYLTPLGVIVLVITANLLLKTYLPESLAFGFDYSVPGMLLPVFVYMSDNKYEKLALFTLGLIFVCVWFGGIQDWSLASVPLLCLYNGKAGKLRLKYLFYLYYPLHLLALQLIALIL